MIRKTYLILIVFFLSFFYAISQEEARLLRFPHIMGNKVVFSYAGDIYTCSADGGLARRLTSDEGYEMFPKISPDGKLIAFTAQYDGNTEVYVMPSDGGVPQRITYTATLDRDDVADRMGPNNIVMAWTPDSKNIIFRSRCHSFNSFRGQLFKVSVEGTLPEEIPILDGGFCSFNEDGNKLVFNKIFREFRTWKYYKGGMADDIWIYDFKKAKAYKIFENDAQDIFPMWYKDKIFFISDRDRTMNLFVYDLKTKKTEKITDFKEYDIKFPSIGGDKIIFENGGYLYYYDIPNKKLIKLTIYIKNDYTIRNKLVDASQYIRTVDASPDGKRLVVSARGEIFNVPAGKGVTLNLTNTDSIHERYGAWSPDGKYVAFISDKTGSYEIYIRKPQGNEQPIQLTKNGETYKFKLKWSPDSKKILWYDKLMRLRYVDIDTKKITEVDKSDSWEISEYSWSPDGRYIAYILPEREHYGRIFIFDTKNSQKYPITQGWFEASSPSFSMDGKYLLFASSRDFKPIYSDLEWNAIYKNMERIYFVLLDKNEKNPFAFDFTENTEKDTVIDPTKVKVKIDFDGIENRILSLPVRPAYYWNIQALNGKIYYTYATYEGKDYFVYSYDLKEKKEKLLGKNFSYQILPDGKKWLIKKGKKYAVIKTPSDAIDLGSIKYADFDDMKVFVNFHHEWKQIFDEVWLQMKYFFYDPNMHGVDWKAIHEKYAVLVPYVNHRKDLTYIMGEMIGELSIGHAYVGGGDVPHIKKIYTGLLGARFYKDPKSGYFKIIKILKGANWSDKLRSPLTEPGLDLKEGDYILAINGQSLKDVPNIYQLLIGRAEKETELYVNSKPTTQGARKIVVKPLKSEADLYYYNWVQNNIEKVSKATNGQVGYIHIPDMLSHGLNEFFKYFYPQMMKKGLIIDDRGNGGGNVSPIIIERLRRELVMQAIARNQTMGSSVPEQMQIGPKVMLINEYSASDGDLFPYQFKTYKIGPVVGKRSWGGVVGIRGSLPLIDGGYLYKPEFGHFSKDGKKWIIEGHGVEPDIVVENNPADAFGGKDTQLDTAVNVVLRLMKNFPDKLTPPPPFPDKSGNK